MMQQSASFVLIFFPFLSFFFFFAFSSGCKKTAEELSREAKVQSLGDMASVAARAHSVHTVLANQVAAETQFVARLLRISLLSPCFVAGTRTRRH